MGCGPPHHCLSAVPLATRLPSLLTEWRLWAGDGLPDAKDRCHRRVMQPLAIDRIAERPLVLRQGGAQGTITSGFHWQANEQYASPTPGRARVRVRRHGSLRTLASKAEMDGFDETETEARKTGP